MVVFLADDIFVPEVRGVSRLAPYEHKNYSQTQTQKCYIELINKICLN